MPPFKDKSSVHIQTDDAPTAGSANLVTSGALKTALDAKESNLTFATIVNGAGLFTEGLARAEGSNIVTYTSPNLTTYATIASPQFTGTPTLPATTTINGQNINDGLTNLNTSVLSLNTDKANLASPTFTGSIQIGSNLILSDNHKNYGTSVSFMAIKSVYDGANNSHAFGCTSGGNSLINSVGSGVVAITHDNVYNHLFHSNGNVSFGINNSTYRLYVNGTVAYTGLFNASDDRLKHNERTIENGLEILRKLHPKFYQKTNEMKTADYDGPLEDGTWRYEAGLIAQDVDLIPELQYLVTKPEADYDDQLRAYTDVPYSLNYQDLFVYGLAATKELDLIVASQANVIGEMTNRLTALESRLAAAGI